MQPVTEDLKAILDAIGLDQSFEVQRKRYDTYGLRGMFRRKWKWHYAFSNIVKPGRQNKKLTGGKAMQVPFSSLPTYLQRVFEQTQVDPADTLRWVLVF